jgi:hypothetical protein
MFYYGVVTLERLCKSELRYELKLRAKPGAKVIWQEGVFNGQKICAASPRAQFPIQPAGGFGSMARRQNDGRAVQAVRAAPPTELTVKSGLPRCLALAQRSGAG